MQSTLYISEIGVIFSPNISLSSITLTLTLYMANIVHASKLKCFNRTIFYTLLFPNLAKIMILNRKVHKLDKSCMICLDVSAEFFCHWGRIFIIRYVKKSL